MTRNNTEPNNVGRIDWDKRWRCSDTTSVFTDYSESLNGKNLFLWAFRMKITEHWARWKSRRCCCHHLSTDDSSGGGFPNATSNFRLRSAAVVFAKQAGGRRAFWNRWQRITAVTPLQPLLRRTAAHIHRNALLVYKVLVTSGIIDPYKLGVEPSITAETSSTRKNYSLLELAEMILPPETFLFLFYDSFLYHQINCN